MLDTILKAVAVAEAPALVAGVWVNAGNPADRVGPYTRGVVSRAWTADSAQVHTVVRSAQKYAKVVARLAPATRAAILQSAARLAAERRADFARLIALELGKPLRDGLGELDRVADTFAV
jgi:acyl-CoA reductase-like NAD-dependent aldehyde dehydrogenase